MRILAAILCACLTLGCAGAPSILSRRAGGGVDISDDAVAFNDAYGRAVSSQILLNILRARDRQPRYYLAMTGIQDSPQLRWQENAAIGSIPLGQGAPNWGVGGLGAQRETISRPSYAVQPFNADTLTRTVFEPIEPYVFAHYWRSGWSRDLLLLLMVERIARTGPDGATVETINEANELFENCSASVTTGGCDYVRAARVFLAAAHGAPAQFSHAAEARALCGLVEAYAPAAPVRPAPPAADEQCDPRFAVGADVYAFRLRSLDDIVYYVGELMRAGSMRAGADAPIEAPILVRAAGLRGGGAGVPLFRILPEARARAEAPIAPARHFAASVAYGEARYYAGPAIGRSCGAAAPDGPCRDDAANGDRSSSVLSLLAELLALNQSPDAIRAPNRLIAE